MDMHIDMHAETRTTGPVATHQPPRSVALAEAVGSERAALRRRNLTLITILFLTAGLVATWTLSANGQGVTYKSMKWYPQFDDPSTIRQMETAAKELARAKSLGDVRNIRYAQIYFGNYLPAKFTQPGAMPEISKLMQDSMKTLSSAQRTNNPGAREMIRLLFPGMKNVAEGDYHPAARIAAISIISRLDSRPGSTTAKRAPVPLAASFPVLLAQYAKESNPDGVRAAALQGLHRYVSIGFPALSPQDSARVIDAMQKLLDADPPAGRDRVAHAYLQRFAVDILATLQPGDESLGETLVRVSTEPNRHDLIALYAVEKLASIGKYGNAAENVDPVVSQWTARAMKAFQYEYERLELMDGIGQASSQPPKPEATVVKREDQPRYIPGAYEEEEYEEEEDYGSYDEGSDEMEDEGDYEDEFGYVYEANPQPPEVIASRRRLNHVLQQIHRGVTGSTKAGVPSRPAGLLAVANDDQKRRIEDWAEEMEELVKALNEPANDDRSKFQVALLEQVDMIRMIAGAAGEEVQAEYDRLPLGLNPFAKLAVLSGASLEQAKDAKPVVIPDDTPPVDPAAPKPPAEVAVPPVDAAASTASPAPAGT